MKAHLTARSHAFRQETQYAASVLQKMILEVELVPTGSAASVRLSVMSPFDVSLSADGRSVTLRPPERLALEEEYMVRVPSAPSYPRGCGGRRPLV